MACFGAQVLPLARDFSSGPVVRPFAPDAWRVSAEAETGVSVAEVAAGGRGLGCWPCSWSCSDLVAGVVAAAWSPALEAFAAADCSPAQAERFVV